MEIDIKPLSPQQKIIMEYIANGFSQKEIAQLMKLKLDTIKKYLKTIRKKYNCKNSFHCVAVLVRYGELTVNPPL